MVFGAELLAAGALLLAVSALALFVARPRDGAVVSFLRPRNTEVIYSLVVTCLIGLGIATVLGGIVGMLGM